MKNDSHQSPKEKSVVVIRRKARTRNSPPSPTQPTLRVSVPITKTEAQATAPPSPPELQQPVSLQTPAATAIADTGPSQKEQEKQARRELLEVVRDRWPQAFPRDYRHVRPLAIGISRDIAAYLPEQPLGRMSSAIGIFQVLLGPAYVRAVLRGGPRSDLDGNPRGEVTSKEQEQARRALPAFFAQRRSKATARPPTPQEDRSASGGDGNKK